MAGSTLSVLDIGTPRPPLPSGYKEVGATIRPPTIRLSEVAPGFAGDPDRNSLVVVGTMNGSADEIRKRVEEALQSHGFDEVNRTTGKSSGTLNHFSLGYSGHGTTGSVSLVDCGGGGRVVIEQVLRPDRVGACRQAELAERCSKLLFHAVALLEEPANGATAPEGSADFRPLAIAARPDGKLEATLHLTNGMQPFLITVSAMRRAFENAGWQRTDLAPCDSPRQSCPPVFDATDKPVDLAYATGGYRATARLVAVGSPNAGGFTLDGKVEEA